MGFFYNVINYRDSLILIEQISLDQKIWSLLTERINIIMKNLDKLLQYKKEQKPSTEEDVNNVTSNDNNVNNQLKSEIFNILIDDLKNIYNYYKIVYLMVCDKFFSERIVSNFLFYLGELKKMKIIVTKKFDKEENTEKDAKDAMRFYQYALNKNPYNIRIYFNIGLILRECMKDFTNSSYWFVRSLSAPGAEMKNLKANLELDFNIIRKIYNEKEYVVDTNAGYINYDVEHFPLMFHRLMGILYMSIDTDKISELIEHLDIILEKVLKYYYNINEELKLEMETKAFCDQIAMMSIFTFHYTLNNIAEYPKSNERIVLQDTINNTNNTTSTTTNCNINNNVNNTNSKMNLKAQNIRYELYNHNLLSITLSDQQQSQMITNPDSIIKEAKSLKYGFKYICQIIKLIIKKILLNYNHINQYFSEKIIIIFFYWFSINYDIVKNLILNDPEMKELLEKFTYVLKNVTDKIPEKEKLIPVINYYITPLEINLLAFMPLTRFFEIYGKKTLLKFEESSDSRTLNKLILLHLIKMINIKPIYSEDYENSYYIKENELSTTTKIEVNSNNIGIINNNTKNDNILDTINLTSSNYNNITNKQSIINVKKHKPLILLDMSNIAMRHGNSIKFSTKGIKSCLSFFIKNGHEVSGFLPEYLFKTDDNLVICNNLNNNNSYRKKKIVPDDVKYLKELHSKGYVIMTPSQDYDDTYNIQYCKSKNAYFVTNDLYRDYLDKFGDSKTREIEKRWIISKRISYTFNKDEFIPGPDSEFFKEFNYSSYLQINTESGNLALSDKGTVKNNMDNTKKDEGKNRN